MKHGDLVRFKVDDYHKLYGVGVLLREVKFKNKKKHWAWFNDARVMVRLNELELISG